MTRTGTWSKVTELTAMGLQYELSQTVGDSIVLVFQGTAIWVWVYKTADSGTIDIYLDDMTTPLISNLDLYSASTIKDILWVSVSLNRVDSAGKLINHQIKIVVKGQGAGSSSKVNIDGYEVEIDRGALQTRTIIEQTVTTKIAEVFGRADYLMVEELAPFTGHYYASPDDWAEDSWGGLLVDIKGRAITKPTGSEDLEFKQRPTTGELDAFITPFIDIDTTITRDASGKITQIQLNDGVKTATSVLSYDAAGNLAAIAKTIS